MANKTIKGVLTNWFVKTTNTQDDNGKYNRIHLVVESELGESFSIRYNESTNAIEVAEKLNEAIENPIESPFVIEIECEEVKGKYDGKQYVYYKPTDEVGKKTLIDLGFKKVMTAEEKAQSRLEAFSK